MKHASSKRAHARSGRAVEANFRVGFKDVSDDGVEIEFNFPSHALER